MDILKILGLTVLTLVFLAHLTNIVFFGGWSKYPEAFEEFKNSEFEKTTLLSKEYWKEYGGQVQSEDGCVWFSEYGDFYIEGHGHIHNHFPSVLDPYHLYWVNKFQNWAEKNIDHEHLE